MSRRAAKITQADVARALRAAKQEGAHEVEVRPDGSLLIRLFPSPDGDTERLIERQKDIIL